MLTYEPDETFAHGLDPRTKLCFQFAFVACAFAHTTPFWLVGLTGVAAIALVAAGLSPVQTVRAYRFFLPFLLIGPLLEALTWGPPWIVPADAWDPALASYRVLLVFFVSSGYVRTTPARDSRAAVQRLVPGKPGQVLGVGVGLTVRFFPLLRRDLATIRDAMAARLGEERPLTHRMRHAAATGLNRAFGRADRLALALQARCFAWNPTLPPLSFTRADAPVLLAAGALAAAAVAL